MKLLGNTILIEPLPDANEQISEGGIICVNHYLKTNLKFRVLAIGPGAQRQRKRPSGKLKTVPAFDKPEVEVGDCILCRAELDDAVTKYAFDDGTGRLIINADQIIASWKQPSVPPTKSPWTSLSNPASIDHPDAAACPRPTGG